MIAILVIRVAESALSIWYSVVRMDIPAIVIYTVLGVLGAWFIAWCLALIGDAQGERRVFGTLIVTIANHLSAQFKLLTLYIRVGGI